MLQNLLQDEWFDNTLSNDPEVVAELNEQRLEFDPYLAADEVAEEEDEEEHALSFADYNDDDNDIDDEVLAADEELAADEQFDSQLILRVLNEFTCCKENCLAKFNTESMRRNCADFRKCLKKERRKLLNVYMSGSLYCDEETPTSKRARLGMNAVENSVSNRYSC